METSTQLVAAEKDIFSDLRLEVSSYSGNYIALFNLFSYNSKVIEKSRLLRQNSQVIDELDVTISFSLLATEMNFVRPTITDEWVLSYIPSFRVASDNIYQQWIL